MRVYDRFDNMSSAKTVIRGESPGDPGPGAKLENRELGFNQLSVLSSAGSLSPGLPSSL